MGRLRPLFDPDPGWLFLIAGLAMVCAAVILPAQRQLHDLDQQVDALAAGEQTALARLKAHAAFRDLLAQEDPTLMARLAASQLNMIRRGERAVLIATTSDAPLTDWVDATVRPVKAEATRYPESRLVRLVTGDKRQWVIASAAFCIFIGLVLGPSRGERRRRHAGEQQEESSDLELGAVAATAVAIAIPDEDVEDDVDTAEFEADAFEGEEDIDAEFDAFESDDEEEELLDADEHEDETSDDAEFVLLAGRDEDEGDRDAFADDDDDDEDDEWEDDEDEEWEEDEGDESEDEDEEEDDADVEDDDELSEDAEEWDEDEEEDEFEEEEDDDDELILETDEGSATPRMLSVSASTDDEAAPVVPEVEIVRRVRSVAAPREEQLDPPPGMLF